MESFIHYFSSNVRVRESSIICLLTRLAIVGLNQRKVRHAHEPCLVTSWAHEFQLISAVIPMLPGFPLYWMFECHVRMGSPCILWRYVVSNTLMINPSSITLFSLAGTYLYETLCKQPRTQFLTSKSSQPRQWWPSSISCLRICPIWTQQK